MLFNLDKGKILSFGKWLTLCHSITTFNYPEKVANFEVRYTVIERLKTEKQIVALVEPFLIIAKKKSTGKSFSRNYPTI